MRLKGKVLLLTVLFLAALFLNGAAALRASPIYSGYQQVRTHMADYIEREMARTGTVGLSIAVVDDQRVVWAEGFGFADAERRIAASPETIYQVASITKLFTASAAMRLAEEEKLDIDRAVQAYLPAFSINTRFPQAGPITPRTIMTHHSGLPSDNFDIDPNKSFSQVTAALKKEYACFPPGYVYSYSNPAFVVLGDVIAAASQKPYHQYVRESFLNPLAMKSTFFDNEKNDRPETAKSYENGRRRPQLPTSGVLPAAGLHSSAVDMARLIRMIFAGGQAGGRQLLSAATLAEMLRPQNEGVALDGSLRVGLGWMLSESTLRHAGRTASHEGHFNNFAANMTLLPDHKLGVIVLANSAEAFSLVGQVADETLKILLAAKGINPPAKHPEKALPATELPEQQASELSGYYATELGVVRVTPGDGKLIARTPDYKFELISRANGNFSVQYKLFGLFPVKITELMDGYFAFETIDGHKVVELRNDRGTFIFGEKAPAPVVSEGWKAMAGTYALNGTNANAPFIPQRIFCRTEGGRIIIEMANPLKEYPAIKTWGFIVQPLSQYEGIIVGLGRWRGDTVRRAIAGGVPHIYYAGLDYRKVGEPSP